jgi:hypothetical protein
MHGDPCIGLDDREDLECDWVPSEELAWTGMIPDGQGVQIFEVLLAAVGKSKDCSLSLSNGGQQVI